MRVVRPHRLLMMHGVAGDDVPAYDPAAGRRSPLIVAQLMLFHGRSQAPETGGRTETACGETAVLCISYRFSLFWCDIICGSF